jgi:hypothetical protein
MDARAFDKIKEGLDEAVGVTRGDAKPARFHVPGGKAMVARSSPVSN